MGNEKDILIELTTSEDGKTANVRLTCSVALDDTDIYLALADYLEKYAFVVQDSDGGVLH